jgi:shikimate kinase
MKPIILIGFMGVGKTSIGKKLAKKLSLNFLDTDKWIEKQAGKTISEIFNENGETIFREWERKSIEHFRKEENIVISTGGGLPCFHDNMQVLNSIGTTIYLKSSIERITEQLKLSRIKRPLIEGKSDQELETYIKNKVQEREKYYLQASHVLTPDRTILDSIVALI